jgi:ribosomal 30S subunit maturation factor RimM
MTQTLGSVRVVTSSSPIANVSTGSVKVSVNPGNAQRVQSISYNSEMKVSNATDVTFENTANNNAVLTYDNITQNFVVQNVPRINGGSF